MSDSEVNVKSNVVAVPREWLMRARRAVEKVEELLDRTASALERASIPYAMIGGNAVAIWVASKDKGAVRNTKDVDVLLARADIHRAASAMADAGFDITEVDGVTIFLDRDDPMPSRGVHVVFANEKIRPHDPHLAPPVIPGIRSPQNVAALDLYELLVLKLIAFRDIDRVHVRDLLKVGLIDDALADKLPADLRERLDEIRANPDG